MAEEHLSPEEAREIRLSVWPAKRLKQIRYYAGQLAAGIPEYEASGIADRIVDRTGLVILAEGRTMVDKVQAVATELHESLRELVTGVPDTGLQPELPLDLEPPGSD